MKTLPAVLLALSVLLVTSRSSPEERVCSVDDVLALMDRAPATEFGKAPHKWSRVGQANRIARAISRAAKTTEQAADLVIYDLYESANTVSAIGDHGKSHGPWQISEDRAAPAVAHDPDKAAPIWLELADKSRSDCADLPDDEQLAEVASGSCKAGRTLARRRAALRRRILAAAMQ